MSIVNKMDLKLKEAAMSGDVSFLKKAIASQPPCDYSYFLSLNYDNNGDSRGNIFHHSTYYGQVEFSKEAMERLPVELVLVLLSQQDDWGRTPLHFAASENRLRIIILILGFYKSHTPPSSPSPIDYDRERIWLASAVYNKLFDALCVSNEESAMEFLSMDMELVCTMVDGKGNSALFLLVKSGRNQVAEKILKSSFSYSVSGPSGSTPLHVAPFSSDVVLRLLLAKHQDLFDVVDDDGYSVIHQWAKVGKVWTLNVLLNEEFPAARAKAFSHLITTEKNEGNNGLHMAASSLNSDFGPTLVRGCLQEIRAATTPDSPNCSPLKTQNNDGNTPLHVAILNKNKEFALQLLSIDSTLCQILNNKGESPLSVAVSSNCEQVVGQILKTQDPLSWKTQNEDGNTPLHLAILRKNEEVALQLLSVDSTLCHILNNKGESPLFVAVSRNCEQVVEQILKNQDLRFNMLRCSDGVTLLHLLPSCQGNFGKRLLEKFWWMMKLPDDKGRTALDEAKERNIPWLVNFLSNPSLIQKESFDWITACERLDETSAVLAFIDSCYDLQAVCLEQNDTPLHHIKLQSYRDYVDFLKIPSIAELKNTTDFEGATPLHRALERKDMLLAKILLIDNGVERNIKDDQGTNAMDLLAKLCKDNDDWAKMCKQIKVNPYLRTSYIQPGTNLGEMRSTLSVVAALLATITFAAGFTLPGGLNSETGDAVLAKKAAFLVFLLSDAYAMCTSMLVLFCLIWSMVSSREMSYFLVDRSVLILMQALYGTIVAFMTGIYAVIAHSSLWAAIVIFIMCSAIGISVNRTILHNALARFIPATYPERRPQTNSERRDLNRLLEEGKAFDSGDDGSRNVQ